MKTDENFQAKVFFFFWLLFGMHLTWTKILLHERFLAQKMNEINKTILLPFLLRSVVLLCWLPSVLVLELVGLTILWPLPLMPLPPPTLAAAATGGWVVEGEEVEGESRRWAGLMAVTVLEVVVVGLFSLSLNVSSSLSPSKASGTGERLSSSLLLGGYTCMWGGEKEREREREREREKERLSMVETTWCTYMYL